MSTLADTNVQLYMVNFQFISAYITAGKHEPMSYYSGDSRQGLQGDTTASDSAPLFGPQNSERSKKTTSKVASINESK